MGKLTIGCFSSLVGSLSLDFAVKLSEAAIQKGHSVDLWVSGNATMLSKKGQKAFKDYSALAKKVEGLMSAGNLHVTACESCAEARGYHEDDTMEGVKRAGGDWYLASSFSADRFLHIGGD